jgi:hypothetical protein
MFKIGFFPQGNGGGGVVPDPLGGDYNIICNTVSNPLYFYVYTAYQINGPFTSIDLVIEHNAQTVAPGSDIDVWYLIDAAWPYPALFEYVGPSSQTYGAFAQTNGNITVTVPVGSWLVLAIDGTTSPLAVPTISGTVKNTSGTLVSNIVGLYRQ